MKHSQSRQLFRRAQERIPGGVNSPARAFKSVGGDPPFIARAEGARLWDVDGNEYLDYVGSWGPMLLGHRHPAVIAALEEALAGGTSFGAPTEREVEMAETIAALVPSIETVRLVNSGTEATMSALRVARGFTGRELAIKFEGNYHGHVDSLLVKAGSGLATLGISDSAGVPAGFAATTIPLPYNSVAAVERAFRGQGEKIAAVIVEPVVGNMGCVPPQPGFLEALRALCSQYGAVLIFDEVMTGFRVALGGAQERFGVTPDMTTLGKVIGGGLPVGAFGGRRENHGGGGAPRPRLSGGHVVGESGGGGGRTGNAAAAPRQSAYLRKTRSAGSAAASGRCRGRGRCRRRSDRQPRRFDDYLLLHRPGRMRLERGVVERHAKIRAILPPHAGVGNLSALLAVRGGVSLRGDDARGYRQDGRLRPAGFRGYVAGRLVAEQGQCSGGGKRCRALN